MGTRLPPCVQYISTRCQKLMKVLTNTSAGLFRVERKLIARQAFSKQVVCLCVCVCVCVCVGGGGQSRRKVRGWRKALCMPLKRWCIYSPYFVDLLVSCGNVAGHPCSIVSEECCLTMEVHGAVHRRHGAVQWHL